MDENEFELPDDNAAEAEGTPFDPMELINNGKAYEVPD